MARVKTSIAIDRPPDEVFDHVVDGRLMNAWNPAAVNKDVRLLTPEPIGVGARFRGTFKGTGETEYEIVAYERPRQAEWVAVTKLGSLRRSVVVEPTVDGSRLIEIGEGDFRGVVRLLTPLLIPVFRKSFQEHGRALKRYLEDRARGDGPLSGA